MKKFGIGLIVILVSLFVSSCENGTSNATSSEIVNLYKSVNGSTISLTYSGNGMQGSFAIKISELEQQGSLLNGASYIDYSFITLDEIRSTTFTGNYSITSSGISLTNINPSSFQIYATFNGPEQKIQNLTLVRNRNAVAKVEEFVKQ